MPAVDALLSLGSHATRLENEYLVRMQELAPSDYLPTWL